MVARSLIAFSAAAVFLVVGAAADEATNVYGADFALREGSHFVIHCNVTNFETLKWQKDNVDIEETTTNNITLLEAKTPWGKTAELRVSYATTGHTGSYRCNSFHNRGQHIYVIGRSSILTNKDEGQHMVLKHGTPLRLECNVTDENPQLTWSRIHIDTEKEEKIDAENARFKVIANHQSSSLTLLRPTIDDAYYDYLCKLSKKSNVGQTMTVTETFTMIWPTACKMAKEHVVVEGESITINCTVFGKPRPDLVWEFENDTISNLTLESDGGRVEVNYTILTIKDTKMTDRGTYRCKPSILKGAYAVSCPTYIRVKDKLSPLWPFLGICAEVLVLCCIILIYEKRRNKSELDESDTDQTPEQKQTPDAGKGVRQRSNN
ncbi:neuroplastin isoform X2 [Neocloeon triangulifer]|uniref:neuroplastin isoform X2 n=1 Tax=Neocloeon triangulifer TaxID=2078957 RepID=UPI00286F9AFE|nr:neuroplastin isoform X2 [Neocloeon triangulifer]